jgi:hypothetical protein
VIFQGFGSAKKHWIRGIAKGRFLGVAKAFTRCVFYADECDEYAEKRLWMADPQTNACRSSSGQRGVTTVLRGVELCVCRRQSMSRKSGNRLSEKDMR